MAKLEVIIRQSDEEAAAAAAAVSQSQTDTDVKMATDDDIYGSVSLQPIKPTVESKAQQSVSVRALAEWQRYRAKSVASMPPRELLPWYAHDDQRDIPHMKMLVRGELPGQGSSCSAERSFKVVASAA